ncbi:MAG: hypothetical protein RL291_2069, partial [Pseudomonadota bacterium]
GVRKGVKFAVARLPKRSTRLIGWLQRRPSLIGFIG